MAIYIDSLFLYDFEWKPLVSEKFFLFLLLTINHRKLFYDVIYPSIGHPRKIYQILYWRWGVCVSTSVICKQHIEHNYNYLECTRIGPDFPPGIPEIF